MIRVAATGDLHFGPDAAGTLRPHLASLPDAADLLLIAGDLTRVGDPAEAAAVAAELSGLGLPVVAVLGNHDYEDGRAETVTAVLEEADIRVLDGTAVVVDVAGVRVGVAGVKGFGGGFAGACGSDFGEPEMKAFIGHTRSHAERLRSALDRLACDVRIVLLHFSPVEGTLKGERREIYPFLGSYLLAEPVDALGADLVVHGHAHGGTERGRTPGGIPVRNVAQPVIKRAYALYRLKEGGVWGRAGDRAQAGGGEGLTDLR